MDLFGTTHYYGGMHIIENPYLTDTVTHEVTEPLSFRSRWIVPLLRPATVPFEPWVKTRTRTASKTVPSRKIYRTPQGLIMHPAMAHEVRTLVALRKQP